MIIVKYTPIQVVSGMGPPIPLSRRRVVQTIGAGAGASLLHVGTAAARQPACPACPEGTRLLAKYEFVDGEFAFAEGACSDTISNISFENKEGEDNEPIEVTFTSPILIHDVAVKFGPNCVLASGSNAVSFTQNSEKDSNGFEGTITLEDTEGAAISHFNLCAGICYQVDFVFGETAEDPVDYRGRLISVRWDGTAVEGGEFQNNSPLTNDDGDEVVTADGVQLNSSETKANVTFDVTLNSADVTLTLVSYAATCPPDFDEDTAYIQDQYDATTVTYTDSVENESLEVKVPGLEQLDELCET